ncbi:MAG TPA: hypothetical protein VFC51_06125 [Chloroflexota bacterium]|nr:hypothetical protein [Chloroflexota bacterium]
MFGQLGNSGSPPELKLEIQDYLRDVVPLIELIEREFQTWMDMGSEDATTLSLERDSDGQHAAVYLWRVGQAATDFVQHEIIRPARRFHMAYSYCLEARAAAADLFREAADLALIKDPGPKVGEANRKLLEARRQWDRAVKARKDLETRLAAL